MVVRNIGDGGPAFPCGTIHEGNSECHDGMSLRDFFAAAALQGFCACSEVRGTTQQIATSAYEFADAMLEERKK